MYPITKAAIQGFQTENKTPATKFLLNETGSTARFRQFCQGNIPLTNASRPISTKELKICGENGITFIELPIAFDAITVVVHPDNNWANALTISELSRLWRKEAQGRIKRRNQVNLDFPSEAIQLCGPGKDFGTFDVFNKTVNGSKKIQGPTTLPAKMITTPCSGSPRKRTRWHTLDMLTTKIMQKTEIPQNCQTER